MVLLVFLALVSGAEISFFALSEVDRQRFQQSNDRAEAQISKLLTKPQRLLTTFVILSHFIKITFITLAVYLVEQVFEESVEEWLLLTITFTVLLLFFGELLPKVYANKNQSRFAKRHAFQVNWAFQLFHPFSRILFNLSEWLEKGVEKRQTKISLAELPEFIDEIPIAGTDSAKDKEILKGVVNFSTTTAQDIMTPRLKIFALDIDTLFPEVLIEIQQWGYSRIPVYRDNIDKIEGILYIKDILPHLDSATTFDWEQLIRPRFFVPENKKIDTLLKDFQEKRIHMAIVVDEYGGTAGLVTMEDIIEEIVGEIHDEFDETEENLYTKVDDFTYVFEGSILLEHFCQIVRVDEDEFEGIRGESKSLGGLLLEMFERFPHPQEEIKFGQFQFTIVSTSAKTIQKIKVQMLLEGKEEIGEL
jgi:gliding motility-associated protein GldE